jgi:adenosylcobinamide-GDP ribazoletransferase
MKAAFAFLTVVGGAASPRPRAARWFPVVGAFVGGAVGLVWWGASEWWPPLVAAALVVVADLALTGMLHLDGLADAADGLLPPLPRERRLAVMRTPDTGAFGLGAVVAVLLLRFAALASIPAPDASDVVTVVALWAVARAGMALVMAVVPYVGGGTTAGFAGSTAAWPSVVVVLALLVDPAATAACAAGFAAVVAFARRRVGGYTGDVLGAAGMVGETAGLVLLAAQW